MTSSRMIISVGTQNRGKLSAVENALGKYEDYRSAKITSCSVDTGVSAQPIGLDEVITGAKNRARLAFESQDSDIGVGIESGIIAVPHTKSGYMDTTACAIFDGKEYFIGLSSCFEYPKEMTDKVLNEGKEISDIALEMGFAKQKSFREGEGMIGVLTKGVITRITYTEQAIHASILQLLNKDHY